jgi:hypothetical protein
MNRRLFLQIFLLVFAIIMLGAVSFAACNLFRTRTQATATPDPAMAYTLAAQTVFAEITQDAGSTAVAELTQIAVATSVPTFPPPGTPSSTFWLPTATSALPSPTFFPPTATQPWPTPIPPTPIPPTAIPCNKASFKGDVSIPDGTTLPPNQRFTKIWRVRNDGACFWDSSYQLVFVNGNPMGAQTVVPIPTVVQPGAQVDLAVDMIAPSQAGAHQGNWYLRDNRGQTFGVGASNSPLWVKIVVAATPNPNPAYAYDFAAYYCHAEWRSQSGLIGCNNPSSSDKGSVVFTTSPQLETRTENEPGLWVRPDNAQTGYLAGLFPPYKIQAGDHFVSEISCMKGFNGCNITFRLDYRLPDGTTKNFGSWNEVTDGKTRTVDQDLSPLVGQTVRFMLVIVNNGNPSQANGIWFVPSIRNKPPTATPKPTLTKTPTPSPSPTNTNTPTPSPTLPIIYPPPP